MHRAPPRGPRRTEGTRRAPHPHHPGRGLARRGAHAVGLRDRAAGRGRGGHQLPDPRVHGGRGSEQPDPRRPRGQGATAVRRVPGAAGGAVLAAPVPGPGPDGRAVPHHRQRRGRAAGARLGRCPGPAERGDPGPAGGGQRGAAGPDPEPGPLPRDPECRAGPDGRREAAGGNAALAGLSARFGIAQCRAAKSLSIRVNPQYGALDYSQISVVPAPNRLAAAASPSPSATASPQLTPHC